MTSEKKYGRREKDRGRQKKQRWDSRKRRIVKQGGRKMKRWVWGSRCRGPVVSQTVSETEGATGPEK